MPFLHASRRSINILIASGVPDSSVGVDVPTSITGKHIFAPDIGKGLKSFVFPCCHNGEIHLPKLRPASEAVERLLRDGSFGKFFRKHIRVINNSFAMASTTIQQIRNQRGNPGMIIAGKFTHLIQSDFADKCTNFHLSRAKNYRSSVTYIEPAPPPSNFRPALGRWLLDPDEQNRLRYDDVLNIQNIPNMHRAPWMQAVKDIRADLMLNNPLFRQMVSAYEQFRAAERSGQNVPTMFAEIEPRRIPPHAHPRTYNAPQGQGNSEVRVLSLRGYSVRDVRCE